jgi:DNA polymerase
VSRRRELAEQLRIWARLGVTYLPRGSGGEAEENATETDVSIDSSKPDEPVPNPAPKPAAPADGVFTPAPEEEPPPWDNLEDCRGDALACTRCSLAETRNSVVFGDGDPHAALMFVGEAPGAEEDKQGLPFVGRAGKLLDKMIIAMGLKRETVYIGNVLKCRPPNNRDPLPHEAAACRPYLETQIRLIKPRIICCLGRHAATRLLDTKQSLKRLRGRFHPYNEHTRVAVTYHPAYCLRNPAAKRDVWEDLQLVMAELGLETPEG